MTIPNTLHPALLCNAYAHGYFPMPDPDSNEIVWLRPDPRAVMPLDGFRVSRSFARRLRHTPTRVSFDDAFHLVMQGCADREETWITPEFFEAYGKLHQEGFAHSVEVWNGPRLVGGVYGVALGGAFFAESMFHRETDASKIALYRLVGHLKDRGFRLLEVQFLTPHLASLGAIEIGDELYQRKLKEALRAPATF